MTVSQKTLAEMWAEVAADSPLLRERLLPAGEAAPGAGFSDLFAVAGNGEIRGLDHYRFALEYIFEGYLLHYERSRLLNPGGANFALLAGDYMYARGLNRITLLEDPGCIRMLADLVSYCAFIHAEKLERRLAIGAWTFTSIRLAERATRKAPTVLAETDLSAGRLAWLKESEKAGLSVMDEITLAYSANQRRVLKELQDGIIQSLDKWMA